MKKIPLIPGLSCGYFIRRFGRKATMLALSLAFALSYLVLVVAACVMVLLVGR